MKKKFIPILALAFFMPYFAGCGANSAQVGDPSVDMSIRQITAGENESIVQILDKARSAVVGVYVELADGYALGSGVAIREGGYVLTNYHVIEGGSSIQLYYADKTTGTAKVMWGDAGLDLAIIKSSKNLPYLSTSSEEKIFVGEDVYALGTPLTLQFKNTVTKGIVGAKDRTLGVDGDNGASFLQSLIQHDASINPGNSGGALINARGEVVGINTLKASEGEGLGFAIPIDVGNAVIERVVDNNNYKQPYLGVFGFDSEIAELYGQSLDQKGVYIVSVDGPAANVGLRKGDIITEFNGVIVEKMLDLRVAILSLDAPKSVVVSYVRGGKSYSVTISLATKA